MNPTGKDVFYISQCSNGSNLYRMVWPFRFLMEFGMVGLNTDKWFTIPQYMKNVQCIRIQGLCHPNYIEMFKNIIEMRNQFGFKIIYELDDLPFREHIPAYNLAKDFYDTNDQRLLIAKYMNSCDEITCTTTYFRDTLKGIITNDKITVVPNLQPRNWIKSYYREGNPDMIYNETRNRPRILYAGSSNHFSIDGSKKDDFSDFVEYIKKTSSSFEWIFMGGCPVHLNEYVQQGKITKLPFTPVREMGYAISKLRPSMYIAPLLDNVFNNCKSNIKLIESGMLGIPFIGSDVEPYKETPYRFRDVDSLDRMISHIMKSRSNYMEASKLGLDVSSQYILENAQNVQAFSELHSTDYGNPERKSLTRWQSYLTKQEILVK